LPHGPGAEWRREDFRVALRGETKLVTQSGGAEIEGRCAGRMIGIGNSDKLVTLVLYGADLYLIGAGGIPPLVGLDAVTVRVGAGADGGVTGCSLGIGVVVIAVSEPCAPVHEELEPTILELGAFAIEVVTAKLIDDDNDNQLGAADVRLSANSD
jgi:hypothetical protein